MDEVMEELMRICAYWVVGNEETARKVAAYFVNHIEENERYAAAYVLIAAEHAQNHDPDEGFFPLDEACKIFSRYDLKESCRELAEEIDFDSDIDTLMLPIKMYMMGIR